ncbi:hypothetical protein M8818_002079 [Zalaria obscura]|uniref:Uncharacterized protein n=1 Tax=Zalaria obscura TaxID=2024903 RepID=A0ACC3SM35_9PEZI
MQRDFLDPDGFGAIECGDPVKFSQVRNVVPAVQRLLSVCRRLGLHVFHTREGHKPDLSDLPASKRLRQLNSPSGAYQSTIGDQGPMGRLLIRGEYGHGIIDELHPLPGEVVIDKAGKGSFWSTSLYRDLLARGVTHLLIAGVTTECCVASTAREATDRGFEYALMRDCTTGFRDDLVAAAIGGICSFEGLFGFVASSDELVARAEEKEPKQPMEWNGELGIENLKDAYDAGVATIVSVAKLVTEKVQKYQAKDPAVWTYLVPPEELIAAAQSLQDRYQGNPKPPLYGIPFAVKDTFDIFGLPTTAACPPYAYRATSTAPVVTALLEAGALFVGKTNLDQLATGLSGCRSPYGCPRAVYGSDRISGGSSSGSSVAVGAGLVSFALGTDTAGSGRVPAAFNGITGFKPTRGTLSAKGLVPACKTLDCVSILTHTVAEARNVWLVMDKGQDLDDIYSKPESQLPTWAIDYRGPREGGFKFGVPPPEALEICTPEFQTLFYEAAQKLQACGGTKIEIDWTPFAGGNALLYEGTLIHERITAFGIDFFDKHLEELHPVTRELFAATLAKDVKPWQVFRDLESQAEFIRAAARIFADQIDVLLVPTVASHPTIEQMEQDPLTLNAKLGEFTHFANVLDLCGLAVNAGWCDGEPGEGKLPFGVTLIGATGTDGRVFDIAKEFERETLGSSKKTAHGDTSLEAW